MFERTVEEMKAQPVTIYIDQRAAGFINEFGCVNSGWYASEHSETSSRSRQVGNKHSLPFLRP